MFIPVAYRHSADIILRIDYIYYAEYTVGFIKNSLAPQKMYNRLHGKFNERKSEVYGKEYAWGKKDNCNLNQRLHHGVNAGI